MHATVRIATLAALWLVAAPLAAVPLWTVEGEHGSVLLLGSIHLLRDVDQPLPEAVQAAYRRARRVVMEVAPHELAPAASRAALQKIGVSGPGRSVADLLAPGQRHDAERLAAAAGLDLRQVAGFEPWFATLVLYNGVLAALGYDSALGVERQLADWAAADGTPVGGLETLDEQLQMFKQLDAELQVQVLMKTLAELAVIDAQAVRLVETWREADLGALERQLELDFAGFEALRDRIVTDRNRAWLPEVEALLAQEGTSLVVVGALHLVGNAGLPALLEERGHQVARWPAE
jgi:uncharacterized protein